MISTAPQSSTWKSTIKDSASILFLKKPTPYKPFYFPWAYEAWHLQQRIHWIPEEVSLAEDVQDWNSRLSPQEKNFLTQIFRFFTQADVEVSHCYMDYYSKIFCINEIKMMLAAFSNMETIHEAAYAYILDTVGMPEIEYEAFLNYKEMRSKWEYMQNFGGDTVEELALTLAFFGAFTEGLQLFASFAMLLNFTRFNKMKGMGQIVSWSIRDETHHTHSIIRLYHTVLQEHPSLSRDFLAEKIYAMGQKVIDHEDAFIDLAFEQGGIEGLEPDEMKQYIRYIADRRFNQLGLQNVYNIEKDPLPWLEAMLAGEFANFFETRVTEYFKMSGNDNWEEAFSQKL